MLGVVRKGIRDVLCLEDNQERPQGAMMKLDDSYDLPVGVNDMQCEMCGISYVRCKFVFNNKGVCGSCAVLQNKKWEVVSLFNGLLLKTLGVM